MFNQIGWPELSVLLLLALFVFGPERLPGMAADASKGLRNLRAYLRGVTDDLKSELGPEVGDLDLASLHPKTFVKKMWDADDEADALVEQLSGPPVVAALLAPGESPPWDPDTT